MNEKLDRILKQVFNYDYYFNENYVGIVEDIVERMLDNDNEDEYEKCYEAINDSLIYYEDQWTVLKYHYVDPKDANFEFAMNMLVDDCMKVYNELKEIK